MSRLLLLLVLSTTAALLPGCDPRSPAALPDAMSEFPLPAEGDAAPRSTHAPSPDAGQLIRSTWPTADDPGMPFYTRIEPAPPHAYIDDGWAAIVFYRKPSCVPAEFDLLQFFDAPAAFGCPHTVQGHSLWHGAIGSGAPQLVVARASGPVPVWFVPEDAMVQALSDGALTMEELEALPGLVTGLADTFQETHHPHPLPPEMGGGGHPVPKLVLDARGELDDGQRFSLHITRADDVPRVVRIRIR